MDELPALTRAELAELDRLASEEHGLPSAVLMENAGRGAAEHVLALLSSRRARAPGAPSAVILCGGGNNGGDGCVVARHLANEGVAVQILATHVAGDLRGDAAIMRRAAEAMGIPVRDAASDESLAADVLVDALLGTGFRGEVRAPMARAIRALNRAREERGTPIVALDLPSGLDADTGIPADPTVTADLTVTFAARKVGFETEAARRHLGRVVVAGIGAPRELVLRLARARKGGLTGP